MSYNEPTYVGQIASVDGGLLRIRLRDDMPSTLVLVNGESYRVGQVGAFVRVPLGYLQLYAICTQVGADAIPERLHDDEAETKSGMEKDIQGFRWMSAVLFGEALGDSFSRGVGQYPTVGDEVHLVTEKDLEVIYGGQESTQDLEIGNIVGSSGIQARLNLSRLVTRHSAVLGSTGSGKSNFVTVFLEEIADKYTSSRCLVIDPHGEYASALDEVARVFKLDPDSEAGERKLWVPYWALKFEELQRVTMGGMQPNAESAVRDKVASMKLDAMQHLDNPPPEEAVSADSPIPFSIRKLWFDLDDFERQTFETTGGQQTAEQRLELEEEGDPETLTPNRYPQPSPYNQAPYKNRQKRRIGSQLELLKRRLLDARLSFLLNPEDGYGPDIDGRVNSDLDELVAEWVGHDDPVTVLDVSGVPSDILQLVVGTMLRIIYDVLFWGSNLPIGGRQQPLLIALEEAHTFLKEGGSSPAHRTVAKVAKEGRKYGVGVMVVSQRPHEVDKTVLSQCGTLISLRVTNPSDRSRISGTLPDDLGGLTSLLPALRTGEALMMGQALVVPSRVRIRKATNRPVGDDPPLPDAWLQDERPNRDYYERAIANWRAQHMNSRDGKE